jgi:hypothetical protein
MYQAAVGLTIFVDPEIIMTLFFEKLNFYIIVNAKVEAKYIIEKPAELVIFYRGNNTEKMGFFKKIIGEVFEVEFEFHRSKLVNVQICKLENVQIL